MSYNLSKAAWDIDCAIPSRKLCLLALADRAKVETQLTWIGRAELARMMDSTENTARSALVILEEEGHISILNRAGRSSVILVHPGEHEAISDESIPHLSATDIKQHLSKGRFYPNDVVAVLDWLVSINRVDPADAAKEITKITAANLKRRRRRTPSDFAGVGPQKNDTESLKNSRPPSQALEAAPSEIEDEPPIESKIESVMNRVNREAPQHSPANSSDEGFKQALKSDPIAEFIGGLSPEEYAEKRAEADRILASRNSR